MSGSIPVGVSAARSAAARQRSHTTCPLTSKYSVSMAVWHAEHATATPPAGATLGASMTAWSNCSAEDAGSDGSDGSPTLLWEPVRWRWLSSARIARWPSVVYSERDAAASTTCSSVFVAHTPGVIGPTDGGSCPSLDA